MPLYSIHESDLQDDENIQFSLASEKASFKPLLLGEVSYTNQKSEWPLCLMVNVQIFFQPKQLIIWVPGMSIIYRKATYPYVCWQEKQQMAIYGCLKTWKQCKSKDIQISLPEDSPGFFYQQNIESSEALETNFGMSFFQKSNQHHITTCRPPPKKNFLVGGFNPFEKY